MKHNTQQIGLRSAGWGLLVRYRWQCLLVAAALGLVAATVKKPDPAEPSPAETPAPGFPPPETPREFVNAGSRLLASGKFREAEGFLETGLGSQEERLQPVALYNLGHVRFAQGAEELKKDPSAGSAAARGREAGSAADEAIKEAEEALKDETIQRMVAAYLNGRGTRRELRAATKAVQKALKTYGTALTRWQRASGDFKSALELNPADEDARHNAEVVDRHIAKLVDSIKELQQAAAMLGEKKQELGEKMQQLKGRIPEEDMPPGAPGDEEEEEEQPKGPEPGDQEGPQREGQEMPITPEQAGWLLESFRLDTDRRLPMGQETTAEQKKRDRPTW